MSKLVAEGTDTGNNRALAVAQFVRASIMVYALSVKYEALAKGLMQIPRVRPYGCRRTTVCLAIASVEDIDVVYNAVIVIVVKREIHLVVKQGTCVCHHFSGMKVVAALVVAAVIAHRLGQCNRSINIKLWCKLTV